MKISVAMAAYNGSKHIKEQISSILSQLLDNDELIISDDGSVDNTVDIVLEYCEKDKRIKLIKGNSKGVIHNFENAIAACSGDIIFLADQDDVWLADKVAKVTSAMIENSAVLVLHDAAVVDEDLKEIKPSFFEVRGTKSGILKNLYKNSYMGCCMAFKAELKGKILPFPKNLPMHDQWIGIIAEHFYKVYILKEKLLLYRRHGGNTSSETHGEFSKMFWNRLKITMKLIKRILFKK